MRQSVATKKSQEETKKQNVFHQVLLLYLSFLTKVVCVVAMGTDLRGRNQWIKNKSEKNNNKLDTKCLTYLEHDSVLLTEVREGMKSPYPERNLSWPDASRPDYTIQCNYQVNKWILGHFPLRSQLAVIHKGVGWNHVMVSVVDEGISQGRGVWESSDPNLVQFYTDRCVILETFLFCQIKMINIAPNYHSFV